MNSADPLARFRDRLSLPLIAAPMFLVSGVDLVVAACRNGVIGSFPTVNCRSPEQLDAWLGDIGAQLRRYGEVSGSQPAPVCPNLIVHRSNARLDRDLQVLLRHKPEIVITSVAKLNIEFTHVMAPMTGRVSRHLVSVGNLVQGSEGNATLLTSIVSLDPIYIYFDVDEATYLQNNKLWFEGRRPSSRDTPNPVQVTLTGEANPSHEGKMDFLDNRLDVSTGTLRSRAVIANKDLSILPGQFGRVRLIGSAPYEALLLPDVAIATDQSRKIVFVVKDDNTVEAKPVTLGPLDEGLRVIREGLKAEDRVIVDGLQRARVGAKVTPQTAPAGGKS